MDFHARVTLLALALVAGRAGAEEYRAPAAAEVPGYFAELMPCRVSRDTGRPVVTCKGQLLEKMSLRELSIARNTIYARYGWDGYRKPWLRDHFHAQKWFKPNPMFSYKLLSDADRKNAHLVATREQGLTDLDLRRMRDAIYERHRGKTIPPDDMIELGLISRALGSFALDDDAREDKAGGLEQPLDVKALRQLSLRDLRLLRNTIYAKRGRPFKSQIVREHFEGMSWYKVDPTYSDDKLNAVDNRNIALIKSVENEFGGPLKDEDYLTEPAMDGA